MSKLRIGFWSIILLLLSFSAFAQPPKFSNEFLSIGVGGRGLGMGGAQVASIGDVTAAYWNPAGLMRIENDVQLGVMHSEYFAGIAKYDYGSVAVPIKDKSKVLAFTLIRFGVDDIPNTLFLVEPDGSINYDNITSFSVADYAFMLSYATKLPIEGLTLGANVKVVRRSAGDFAGAWGFGLDAGAQYKLKDFSFGLMVRDITSTFNAWSFDFTEEEKAVLLSTGNELPQNSLEVTLPKIILGASYTYNLKDKFSITPELNFDITTDGKRNVLIKGDPISVDPRFGLELGYADIIYLRGGLSNIQSSTDDRGNKITTVQPNIGVGVKIKTVSLDYSFTDIGNVSDALYSHVFSLNIGINKRAKQ